jgi:ribulose-bisphosphate carboxylase large chain
LIAPGLTGLDAMRELAASHLGLPIFAHPAFIGTYALNAQGIACDALFGTLMRMAGADAVIFPNYGGRFPLSKAECLGIARAGREKLGSLKPVFPAPAGGMQLENIEEMTRTYGIDMLVLVGGGLFTCGGGLAENCRRFLAELGK